MARLLFRSLTSEIFTLKYTKHKGNESAINQGGQEGFNLEHTQKEKMTRNQQKRLKKRRERDG